MGPIGLICPEFVSATNDVRFPGQLRDDESGLYYNWHRYYSPKVGRYYQADPIGFGGGTNLYGYASGSPVMGSDASGLVSMDDLLARMPTLPHWLVNGSAGFGDAILQGVAESESMMLGAIPLGAGNAELANPGQTLRSWFGAENVVDPCSKSYRVGVLTGAVVLTALTEGASFESEVAWIGAQAVKRELTGQVHHAISRRIFNALEGHSNLSGLFEFRDPRFVTQAIDPAAHMGYQQWHRELDREVARWVMRNTEASQSSFEAFLRARYSQPDLLRRFPNGL